MRKCRHCGVGVLPELSTCYGCARPLTAEPEWRCKECRSGNARWRTACYTCGAPSPPAGPAAPTGPAGYWGAVDPGGWRAPAPVLTTARRVAMIAEVEAGAAAAGGDRSGAGFRWPFGGRKRAAAVPERPARLAEDPQHADL